jgi:hypothetical protein
MTAETETDNGTTTKKITVVHCWSAPRSRSTALLYSFEARRDDCIAIDEPLYREWLIKRGDAVDRPYTREMLDGKPPAQDEPHCEATIMQWKRELLTLEERLKDGAKSLPNGGVIFCKHMAKHSFLYDFENEIEAHDLPDTELVHKHLLLIRDPVAVLSSWSVSASVHGNNPTPDEVGIVPLLSIYSSLQSKAQHKHSKAPVALLDSDELIQDPESVLQNVCEDLGIEYKVWMMSWHSGPHKCDGPWAKWWYHDVHRSSGWRVKTPDYGSKRYRIMNPVLMDAFRASFPAYQFLKSLTRGHKARGPPPNEIYEDPRNEHLLAYIGAPGRGRLVPREMAGVSPWDSSVQGGDAVWYVGCCRAAGALMRLQADFIILFTMLTIFLQLSLLQGRFASLQRQDSVA